MAKKVIAKLSKLESIRFTKIIQAKKSSKTGAYTFSEKVIPSERVKEFIENKAKL